MGGFGIERSVTQWLEVMQKQYKCFSESLMSNKKRNPNKSSTAARDMLIGLRILIGLLQGGCYPLLVGLWGKWAPK